MIIGNVKIRQLLRDIVFGIIGFMKRKLREIIEWSMSDDIWLEYPYNKKEGGPKNGKKEL
jgi:hypothetical protein